MSAIRLLQAERKEEIQHLHRQFMSGGILQRELWEEAEKFLIQREIYDVILAEEQDLREYKQTLLDSGNYTKKQVKEQSSALRKVCREESNTGGNIKHRLYSCHTYQIWSWLRILNMSEINRNWCGIFLEEHLKN